MNTTYNILDKSDWLSYSSIQWILSDIFFIFPTSLLLKTNSEYLRIKQYCTNQQVCSDKHTAGTRAKFPHDYIPLFLVHITML